MTVKSVQENKEVKSENLIVESILQKDLPFDKVTDWNERAKENGIDYASQTVTHNSIDGFQEVTVKSEFHFLPLANLKPNPKNPRSKKEFNLTELRNKFEITNYLMTDCLVVKKSEKGFVVLRGNQRLKLIKEQQGDWENYYSLVPCLVIADSFELVTCDNQIDDDQVKLGLYGNFIQVKMLIELGFTDSQIQRFLKWSKGSHTAVANYRKILALPKEVLKTIEAGFKDGKITKAQAIALAKAHAKDVKDGGIATEQGELLTQALPTLEKAVVDKEKPSPISQKKLITNRPANAIGSLYFYLAAGFSSVDQAKLDEIALNCFNSLDDKTKEELKAMSVDCAKLDKKYQIS